MFQKSKLSTAVKFAIGATMIASLSGCLVEGSTSVTKTSGTFERVSNPRGTVVGLVQDTNGNPLRGVKVYLAGMSKSTDTGGNYRFNNVPVTNAVGSTDTGHNPLSITIAAPEGYLGATVTVEPVAQHTANGDNGGGSVNPVSVFVDGFIAQAGTAVLPALDADVTGILRNNTTEEPIGNQEISLDFEWVMSTNQQQAHDGVTATYATYNYTTTTASDGSFAFANIPNDAEMRIVVGNYEVDSVQYNGASVGGASSFETKDEVAVVNLGNVKVTPHVSIDDAPPYVTAVDSVANRTDTVGQMHDDVVDTFTVTFSEQMDTTKVDSNSVLLRDVTNEAWLTATVTWDTTGTMMTVTSATPFVGGAEIHLHMLDVDFTDMAGNLLKKEDVATDSVDYDYIATTVNGTTADRFVELQLEVFADANPNALAITNLVQVATDDSGTDDDAMYQAASDAFNDTKDGTADIQQLNSQDDDESDTNYDASERLGGLLGAQGGSGTVDVDVARITFDASNAASYTMTIVRNGTVLDPDGGDYTVSNVVSASDTTGTANAVTTNVDEIAFTAASGAVVGFTLENVSPGDVVTITPNDDFGYVGTAVNVTLADNVVPRTVLQNSYGENSPWHDGVTTPTYGDGGELSQLGSSSVGVPYLAISAGLLDNLDVNGDPVDGSAGNHDNALTEELMAHNTIDDVNCLATDPCIDPATGVYDANAWTTFSGSLSRTVGVAMSEDVSISGAPTVTGVSTALSNWAANNDLTNASQDDGGNVMYNTVDLVQFDAADVIALANTDNDGTIDFSNVITDDAGNTATSATAASVVIRDAMPPMVTSSTYNGTSLTVTFNEDIVPDTTMVIDLNGTTLNVTTSVVNAHTAAAAADKNKLVFTMSDLNIVPGSSGFYSDLSFGTDMNRPSYAEATGGTVSAHYDVDFVDIEDVHGNNWGQENANVTAPVFAGVSSIATADVTINNNSSANFVIGTVTNAPVTYTFTYSADHAIDMQASFGVANDATGLTGAEVGANFVYTEASGDLIDTGAAGTNATLSADRRTLTVNVVTQGTGAALAAGDSFGPAAPIVSDFDPALNETAANLTDTL